MVVEFLITNYEKLYEEKSKELIEKVNTSKEWKERIRRASVNVSKEMAEELRSPSKMEIYFNNEKKIEKKNEKNDTVLPPKKIPPPKPPTSSGEKNLYEPLIVPKKLDFRSSDNNLKLVNSDNKNNDEFLRSRDRVSKTISIMQRGKEEKPVPVEKPKPVEKIEVSKKNLNLIQKVIQKQILKRDK